MKAASLRDFSLIIALACIGLFFTWQTNGNFLAPGNIHQMSIQLASLATAAMGLLLIILLGPIDLSVGSAMALTGAITATLINWHGLPAPVAMGIGLACGVVWCCMP